MSIEVIEVGEMDRSKDEFFTGPDIGACVLRAGFFYTRYGQVYPYHATIRMMPCSAHEENYADWSEEHRLAVREGYAAQQQQWDAYAAQERAERHQLVRCAREKLTDEEYNAVIQQAIAEDRDGFECEGLPEDLEEDEPEDDDGA